MQPIWSIAFSSGTLLLRGDGQLGRWLTCVLYRATKEPRGNFTFAAMIISCGTLQSCPSCQLCATCANKCHSQRLHEENNSLVKPHELVWKRRLSSHPISKRYLALVFIQPILRAYTGQCQHILLMQSWNTRIPEAGEAHHCLYGLAWSIILIVAHQIPASSQPVITCLPWNVEPDTLPLSLSISCRHRRECSLYP